MKPFSQACENNKDPILVCLTSFFADRKRVLEFGSGTGQHAVYFAKHLPHLQWQSGDLPAHHAGIQAWITEAALPNVLSPVTVDAEAGTWNLGQYDAIFSANTLHIMSWPQVQATFKHIATVLQPQGKLAVYGPFNYGGNFTSDSNARFDQWLKQQAPHQGIRDFAEVNALAEKIGLRLVMDNAMPANNRLLFWQRN